MNNALRQELEQIQSNFALSRRQLTEISNAFYKDMSEKSMLKMLKTFVSPVKELNSGEYITVDLGGSNLRASLFVVKNQKIKLTKMITIKLRTKIKNYTTNQYSLRDLYLMIFKKLSKILNSKKEYNLVHTFSFAFNSMSKNEATVLKFTKGFDLKDSDNIKIENCLKSVIEELKLKINVVAIINDSVSTLVSGNFKNKSCNIACIVGTGHNACFIDSSKEIINIESAYFNQHLPTTSYDNKFIELFPSAKLNLLEIFVGGKYLSSIAQVILDDLYEKKLIGKTSGIMTSTLTMAMHNKLTFGYKPYQKECFAEIGKILFGRAAKLISAEILAIIKYIDTEFKKNHTVVFDGSVYEKNRYFRECISAELESLCPDNYQKINHELIKDGSSIGATIIASEKQ